jgi:uncharacterized membrane protein
MRKFMQFITIAGIGGYAILFGTLVTKLRSFLENGELTLLSFIGSFVVFILITYIVGRILLWLVKVYEDEIKGKKIF